MLHDPELFRAFLDSRGVLKPLGETFAQAGVAERTLELAGEHERMALPGPSREDLLTMLG
jgi:hypothetical protein